MLDELKPSVRPKIYAVIGAALSYAHGFAAAALAGTPYCVVTAIAAVVFLVGAFLVIMAAFIEGPYLDRKHDELSCDD